MVKRVIVAGATGFIGRALVCALRARGDSVVALSRRIAPAREQLDEGVTALEWHPDAPTDAWASAIARADGIVNVAGRRAVGVRYTAGVKRAIWASRVVTTELLVGAMGKVAEASRPRVLVNASAVGYYGGHADSELLDESSPPGSDFLARVCLAWEEAARGAERFGVRVVTPRMGVVLGPGGGALASLRVPLAWFVGGPVGTGHQALSWIHLDDLVSVLLRCLDDDKVSGPVNATAPEPTDNLTLVRELGTVMKRPVWLPAPAALVRLALGEGAGPLLAGQAVLPRILRELGFDWKHAELRGAVAAAMGGEA